MTFADGQPLFEQLARNRGMVPMRNDEVVAVSQGDASLRLRSIGAGVCLEITHGPSGGPSFGWLDLYSDPNDPLFPSFEDCLEFGFDLMCP